MKKRVNQQGFTLMELMVVIVIVAILAAVAVPLYINYVRDAQRSEAKAAIGAIVTAEQVYLLKNSTYTDLQGLMDSKMVDISEAAGANDGTTGKWRFKVTNYSSQTPPTSFDVCATNNTDKNLMVGYHFDRTGTSSNGGKFTDDTCP